MVTLHPVVAYFRNPNDENEISHKSFVYVSDELIHRCSTVYAFLKDLVPRLKEFIPELSCIHYLSDSPTSQYRNKSIFHIIANHLQLFGAKGSWQCFEAGHGKGPCDGVEAVSKRMADEAVRQRRITIQDASNYFEWTIQRHRHQNTTQKHIKMTTTDQQKTTGGGSRFLRRLSSSCFV
jgi:hypothetical protein